MRLLGQVLALSLITLLDYLELFHQLGTRVVNMGRIHGCFRNYRSLKWWLQDTSNEHKNTFPEECYRQAGNFCIKHCRNTVIFTQAESEAVLSPLGLWIWDYRTLPSMNKNSTYFTRYTQAWAIKVTLPLIYLI